MTALTRGSGRWLFLGAFALLGLFAMHGLGSHGVSHEAGHEAGHEVGHEAGHEAGHGVALFVGTSALGHSEGLAEIAACGSDCGDQDVLMTLCLAVLGAGIAVLTFGLLLLLRPAALRPPRWFGSTRAILRSARGPGPPGRFALSVQRC